MAPWVYVVLTTVVTVVDEVTVVFASLAELEAFIVCMVVVREWEKGKMKWWMVEQRGVWEVREKIRGLVFMFWEVRREGEAGIGNGTHKAQLSNRRRTQHKPNSKQGQGEELALWRMKPINAKCCDCKLAL